MTDPNQQPKKEAQVPKGKEKAKDVKKAAKMPGEKRSSKAGKKKWSKAKAKEKLQNATFFDKERYDKMIQEVPKMKLITIAAVSEKMKLSGYHSVFTDFPQQELRSPSH